MFTKSNELNEGVMMTGCLVGDFRYFMRSKQVWGNTGDVVMDDELFHVETPEGTVSYTNDEQTLKTLANPKPLTEDFLDAHDDSEFVWIESGFILATKESNVTKFVRCTTTANDEFASDLPTVFKAWHYNEPHMLRLNEPDADD